MERNGLAVDPAWHIDATFDLETAMDAAVKLLRGKRITALFCDDDLLVAAVYRAARTLGLSIPDDLSVVGLNDIEMARVIQPELTTVAIPAETVANLSVERLLGQLNRSPSKETSVIALDLKVRGSTAKARHKT